MDWPPVGTLPRHTFTIMPASPVSWGGIHYPVGSPASAAWPSANRAIFVPFRLPSPTVVTKLFVLNGATASGNLDIGIYTHDGTRLLSTGSTAQAGTNVLQVVDITDTLIGAGLLYLALAMDGTTGTAFRWSDGNAPLMQACGLAQQASAFALPATATLAAVTSNYIPVFGALCERTAL